jgi:SAM-dependent methyltransferase
MAGVAFEDLVCPACGSDLTADDAELICTACLRRYEIRDGVARLLPPELSEALQRTAAAFGWQWRHFVDMSEVFEPQFLDWIYPLEPKDFAGADVLDAGCGIGRHAYFAARYGARSVTAFDLSAAVETARSNLREQANARVVQGDIMRPPFRLAADGGGFDLVYSIGVLHHLPDPRAGFLSLARYLRPGGRIAIWVYGHENNGLVRNVIEPVRRGTTKVPAPLLRAVAWPIAVVFYALVKGLYGSHAPSRRLGRHLPLAEYVSSLAKFPFRPVYTIVFDQLVAPTAHYIRGEELREWFDTAGLTDVTISHRHGNSWRATGRAPTG